MEKILFQIFQKIKNNKLIFEMIMKNKINKFKMK